MSAAQEGHDFTLRDMDSCFVPLVRKTDDVFSGIDSSGVDALTQESPLCCYLDFADCRAVNSLCPAVAFPVTHLHGSVCCALTCHSVICVAALCCG